MARTPYVKILAALIAAALAFAGATTPALAAGSPQYLRLAYDGSIWEVSDDGIYELTWNDWADLGFPAWSNAPTDYVKYPWSPSISAVTYFGSDPDEWLWEHLDFGMWSAAGRPAPRNAGWIGGSSIHQWSTSPELFLTDPGGQVHKLSYAEWAATGFQAFEYIANQGFVTHWWDSTGSIALMCDVAMGRGRNVSFAEWSSAGYPTPQTVTRMPRDNVWWFGPRTPTSPIGGQIYYQSATGDVGLSFAQWKALGQPAPGSRVPNNYYSCGSDWIETWPPTG
jgi:hypothetical protein